MDRLHLKIIGLLSGETGSLLDAGAGGGELSRALIDNGFKVKSCDIQPRDFKYGRCYRVDLNGRLPYKNSEFDNVVCAEVLEHLENPHNLLREFNRVLRKGGILVISTPNIANVFSRIKFLLTGKFFCFSDEERSLGHLSPVTWWELDETLVKYGFRVEVVTSNAHLMLSGCKGSVVSAKRMVVKIAYLFLYPFMQPKNKELLKGDSLIFKAIKVKSI